MTIVRLPRKFKAGATLLDDIDENATPEAVIAAYSRTYPALASATVDTANPIVDNGALVFTVRMPDIQTKGARRQPGVTPRCPSSEHVLLADLDRWGESTEQAQARGSNLGQLYQDLQRIQARPVGAIDPYLMPMA